MATTPAGRAAKAALLFLMGCQARPEPAPPTPSGDAERILELLDDVDCAAPEPCLHPVDLNGRERASVRVHAPRKVFVRDVRVGPESWLEGAVGMLDHPELARGDGVTARVLVDAPSGGTTILWSRHLDPARIPDDRGWSAFRASLAPWSGSVVDLGFEILPNGNRAYDRAAWSELRHRRAPEDDTRPDPSEPRFASARAGSGPNILLVVVDTLRADRTGLHGARRDTTPNLDALARSGTVFLRASSQASWTLPATASLLTGLHPPAHGVTGDRPLHGSFVTVAERARERGLATVAISANPLVGPEAGLAQGFGDFLHLPWARGEALVDLAVTLLQERADRRWLAYLHFIDPHDPYDAREPFASRFRRPDQPRGAFADPAAFRELVDSRNFGDRSLACSPADLDDLLASYDGEIASWDHELGRLTRALDARGLLRDTVVVVTSDHGEEFLEHGRLKHGPQLFGESLHVPLVVRGPGIARSAVDRPVETRRVHDLVRALLAAGPGDSVDVSRWIAEGDQAVFAHSGHGRLEGIPGRVEIASIQRGRWKLIHSVVGGTIGLYDLVADPGETRDRSATDPGPFAHLLGQLEAWRSRAAPPDTEPIPGIESELAALGYL